MAMVTITIGVLFAAGFAGGYFVRAGMSWLRRNKVRKQRAERRADIVIGETAGQNVQPVAAAAHANV
jgi:uncharacterized membrane protein YciS (DUF1049 family)